MAEQGSNTQHEQPQPADARRRLCRAWLLQRGVEPDAIVLTADEQIPKGSLCGSDAASHTLPMAGEAGGRRPRHHG